MKLATYFTSLIFILVYPTYSHSDVMETNINCDSSGLINFVEEQKISICDALIEDAILIGEVAYGCENHFQILEHNLIEIATSTLYIRHKLCPKTARVFRDFGSVTRHKTLFLQNEGLQLLESCGEDLSSVFVRGKQFFSVSTSIDPVSLELYGINYDSALSLCYTKLY